MSDPAAGRLVSPRRSTPRSSLRRLLLQSGQLLAGQMVALLLTLVQGIVIARYLGPARLGLVALVTVFVLTIHQLLDFRSWETTIRWVSGFQSTGDLERATATLKAVLLLDTAVAVVAWATTFLSAGFVSAVLLRDAGAAGWIRLWSFSILIAIPYGSLTAILRLDQRISALSAQTVFAAVVRLAAVLAVVAAGAGVGALLAGYLAASLLATVALMLPAARAWRRQRLKSLRSVSVRLLKGHVRSMVGFLAATNASALVKLFQRNAEILLAGYSLMPTDVGLLRAARVLSDQLTVPTNALYQLSYPEYARLWHAGQRAELRQVVRRLTLLGSAVALLGLLTFVSFGDLIVRVTVGPQYLSAVPAMQWLTAGVALAVASHAAHPVLLATGRAGRSLAATASGSAIQLLCLVTLLPVLGIKAAGVGLVGFHIVWIAIVLPAVTKELR